MSAFGIKVISSAALHPEGRGQLERLVHTVKLLLRKFLATRPNLNWEYLPYLITKIINNTVSPKTGFKPVEMVFGRENAGNLFLEHSLASPHYSIKNNSTMIELISKEIKEMSQIAQENITELRKEQIARLNKNRSAKKFNKDEIVFVIDRSIVEGSSQVLRTKFSNSPFVVIQPSFTTTVVRRLADGFQALYSNGDLKLYKPLSPEFSNLPPEVSKVLLHEFKDFISTDFSTLAKHDKLELPESLELFKPDENYQDDDDANEDGVDINIFNENLQAGIQPIADAILDTSDATLTTADNEDTTVQPMVIPILKRSEKVNEVISDSEESESDVDDPGMTLRFGRKRVNFSQDA